MSCGGGYLVSWRSDRKDKVNNLIPGNDNNRSSSCIIYYFTILTTYSIIIGYGGDCGDSSSEILINILECSK